MEELRPGRSRQVQTMDHIVLHAEREAVDAGPAVVVVIQRTLVIMVMAVALIGMPAAIVVLVGVHRTGGFTGGKHARVQPGKDTEDQEPCEQVAHA